MKQTNDAPGINATEKIALLLFLLLLLIFSGLQKALAQVTPDSVIVQIETHDGNHFTGRLLQEDENTVVVMTQTAGKITIAKSAIKRIDKLFASQRRADGYWTDNPQATRNFWAPTGYGLKPGEGYYQNIWVLFNQVSVGLTRHLSMGVGMVPLFLFGSPSSPVWLTPKLSLPLSKDKVNVGIGALIGTTSIGEKGNGFGIVYGSSTFGSRDRNFTIGVGYNYNAANAIQRPLINFSALVRVSAKGYFISENYIIPSGDSNVVLIGIGGRRLANRTGIDFGLMLPFQENMSTLVAIPWLGLTAPLGKAAKRG
jgi:hypothetical protein